MDRFIVLLPMLLLLSAYSGEAAAQRVRRDAPAESAAITVAARIGSKNYQGSGTGSCRHEPEASIHGVAAALWMVQFAAQNRSLKQLNLTLWRPKDGSRDQLSLSLETGSGSHHIETGGKGGDNGEASVTILPSGPGGRLEISGKEAGGKPLQVTIDCPAFAAIEAEGG
jgi:hypothetical protein